MYGKSFSRMYQGSMVGAGSHVFAIWGYCISCADPEDHTVELNPVLLSAVIGDSQERVQAAIDFLCAPDKQSHCKDHEGRRLLHQGGYAYFLVTHEQYRDVKNSEELREYFREQKRKQRQSKTVQDSPNTPASAYVSASESGMGDCKEGRKGDMTDEDFWKTIQEKFSWVDVSRERSKMEAWLLTPKGRGRHITRRFVVNWLSKIDAPMEQRRPALPQPLTPAQLEIQRKALAKRDEANGKDHA